ncbi:pimeloyl-ACP methyl ester carboxylesterase [Kitasatospora sp. GP30]|uniref:alpha/beta fold hydrolase n=1 Tax=Kitasatospora sp. GP30 TaxID=3035084 RepID=UPI000C710F4C|nr:alpha/beta hydrolase [Kitasatospora sp. GP30]MDH6142857.1 pimeloyl-ACP methyl ester carboxylesterase [Kitasatospora sp. GP30]
MRSVTAPAAAGRADGRHEVVVTRHQWRGHSYEARYVRGASSRTAPLVLVGGAFQTKEGWGRLEREFLAFADVLAVDLPGWGSSPVLPEQYGTDFLSDALSQILDDLELPEVNLLGGSYGSAVVYRLAQRQPDRVAKTVLAGTMMRIPEQAHAPIRRSLELLATGEMDEFAEVTLGMLINADTVASVVAGARVRRFLQRRLLNMTPRDKQQFIANSRRLLQHEGLDLRHPPTMPVLAIVGEHDNFTTPERCRALARTCPDSRFAVVADADHMLPVERPVELADLVRRFLLGEPLDDVGYCRTVERIAPLVLV